MADLTKYVILDTDGGIDDIWALLMLLTLGKLANIKILAITTSFGNTDLHYVTSNLFRVLDAVGGTEIPVYNGRSEPFLPDLRNTDNLERYYGTDGFGDMLPMLKTTNRVQKTVAAEAIIHLVKNYPKKVSFLCLGPLSNLALALLVQENLADKFKEIYIMGGNAYGHGNVRPANTAEWNFYSDPEAAHIVLSKASCPIHIMTWEACSPESFLVTRKWLIDGPLANISSKVLDLIKAAEKRVFALQSSQITWGPPDAILVASFLFDKEVILKDEWHHAYVETSGFYTRGQVAIEKFDSNLLKNVHFIVKVNETAFMQHIVAVANATKVFV